jgi:hypothetical protein
MKSKILKISFLKREINFLFTAIGKPCDGLYWAARCSA